MPAVTRLLEIDYGGFIVGGAGDAILTDLIRIQEVSYERAIVEFTFSMEKAVSDADFATKVQAAEAAFRTPRQDLVIRQGGNIVRTYSHTNSTGFNAQPFISKIGDPGGDTSRTRIYTVRIEFQLPADLAGQNGRRDSRVELRWDGSRNRFLTISGTYTALTAAGARAQYLAQIQAYVTSITGTLTGTWEVTEEEVATDDADKVAEFRIVLEDLGYNQSLSALDDNRIVRQTLRVTVQQDLSSNAQGSLSIPDVAGRLSAFESAAALSNQAVGSTAAEQKARVLAIESAMANNNDGSRSISVDPLVTVLITYDAWIDKTVTQNLSELWESTIKPHIIESATSVLGESGDPSTATLVRIAPEYDLDDNRISASVEMLAAGDSNLTEFRLSTSMKDIFGTGIVPVHDDGAPYAKYVFRGPARRVFTRSIHRKAVQKNARRRPKWGGFFNAAPAGQNLFGGFFGIKPDRAPGPGAIVSPAGRSHNIDKPLGEVPTGFLPITNDNTETPIVVGFSSDGLPVTEERIEEVWEYAQPYSAPAGAVITPVGQAQP